ncbi:MAG: sulfatase [Spirochaetaceae bacterium]
MSDTRDTENLLVIVVDQLRADRIPATHDESDSLSWTTRHMRRLADRGTVYRNTYTAAPVCNPARQSMLTGYYPDRHKVRTNRDRTADGLSTVAHIAGNAGIETICVGTNGWRGSYPDGFARTVQTRRWAKDLREETRAVFEAENTRHIRRTTGGPSPRGVEEYHGTVVARSTCEELERLSADRNRFLLWCNIPEPHPPFRPPADVYRRVLDSMQERSSTETTDHPAPYMQKLRRDWEHLSPLEWKQLTAAYHGMVAVADEWIGRILETLAQTGLETSTTVLLVGDHGEMLGEHGLMLKFNFRQAAVRVPLVLARPDSGPAVSDRLTTTADVFTSALDILGLQSSATTDSRSLFDEEGHDTVCSFFDTHSMVTDGRWKLVHYGDGSEELFQTDDDPGELRNRIDTSDAAPHRKRLTEHLRT